MQATVQDFLTAFGEEEAILLTDPNRTDIDYVRIENALQDAEAEIYTILGVVYSSEELARPCRDLKNIAVKIGRWNLDQANNPRDHVHTVYEQCLERLRAIAARDAALLFDEPTGDAEPEEEIVPYFGGRFLIQQGTPRTGFSGWGER